MSMTSQVVFTVDSKTKARAMERARREGVPFASVLKLATRAFAAGDFSIGITQEIRPEKIKLWERQSRLMDQGKGRRFASAKAARQYIASL